MPNTIKRKRTRKRPHKPPLKPKKACTRCLKETRDWYPTTGGARLPLVRCSDCFELETRRVTQFDTTRECAQKLERKETPLSNG